jgi:hypothetical protein
VAVSVVSFAQSAWNVTTSPKTFTGLAWTAGDVIVVVGGNENATFTISNPTNANLTFGAAKASILTSGAAECTAYVWAATAATSQTGQTVSVTGSTGGHWGVACWVFTGTSGSTANASANRTEAGFTFTPTAGSAVVYFFGDWNANVTNQTLATGTGTGTERADSSDPSTWGWYVGDWVGVTATSTTFGVASYTGLLVGHVVLEILASATSVTGTVAETQDNQTAAASGIIEITGTSTRTQANQTSTATGVLGYSGTSARTQDNQTSTATGTSAAPGVSGSVAETQDNQTSTATGILGYSGTSARTQANQTSAASGTFTPLPITGTLAETQDNQTSTASGTFSTGITGTSAVTQANQTSTATGMLGYSGTSARTQANQTSTASGTVATGITGTLASTQANQTAAASGWISVTGLVAQTQADQVSSASGATVAPPTGLEPVAVFTPPVVEGNPPTVSFGHPGNKLMRNYGNWAQGATVWKDSQGVWHQSSNPYEGGAVHIVHNLWAGGVGPTSTYSTPDEGLATAERVYLGGHVYQITAEEESELVAAGYADNITPLP